MRTNNLSQIICNARIFVPLRENEAVCVAASIKKPIHNVKEAGNSRILSAPGTRPIADKLLSSSLEYVVRRRRKAVRRLETGGAYRDRTDDPLLAKQVLSQLS